MSEIQSEIQSLAPSAIVPLFTLDTSPIGGPVLRFTQAAKSGGEAISFNGIKYEPTDVEFEGMETSGVGAIPTPTIRITSNDPNVHAIANTYGDLNGCVLSRVRTYAKFLDDEPDEDPSAYFGPDIFSFERKITDDGETYEWELSAAFDQEGRNFPGRTVVANTCMWRYRIWDQEAQGFDYTRAQCPYAGAQSFDINNLPVANGADDVPARNIGCCKARFGDTAPLPFGGFPGAARIK